MVEARSRSAQGVAGRPRDRHIDAAVIAATLETLDETGYPGLSLEEVARRAGTSRPAIYRRWSGRAPLALAAIATRLDVPTPPDSGCTLCDIAESFQVFLAAYRTIRPDVLSALYADCATDPQLRARYVETVVEPSRRAVAHTLDRAIARGDLRADLDRELLLDIVGSLVHYRATFGRRHLSDAEAGQAVEALLRGAAVDYAALLAHSETLERQHESASGAPHAH
ncbi:TetR/AcrR family transcriptional regulator [Streptomyces radicis]|uniref:TetR/AcrR family transcriptional regulator n=1 Tax=Streptomyces radicis TaxID=1750517 RepID=A0A3A9WML3_9ACTN|nr:TetR/AcrR family transcriptional regulator [Streptomyces radicis]RKN07407.1 TetR/AcrR family transcriptional regulator [Streptomyces radicis]RKN19574.1 TetR/AcrR family transcriptional regulator [Streptomyces radicis]